MSAPEKIYGWMDSQLSIARFYGGINFNGHRYVIDMNDPEHPLVRQDPPQKGKKAKPKITKEQAQKNFESMLNRELPL